MEKEQFETAGKDELLFINSFFILFRTAHYVEASNATYQTQSSRFYVNFRRLVDEHGRISIKVIEGRIFVRDKMVKFDSDGMVRAREIIDTWRHLGIGGIILDDSLDNRRIDKFVYLIAKLERSKLGMEDVSERLKDLGIDGIALLATEEKKEQVVLTEENRTFMRRAARVTFFRAISVVQDAMFRTANDKDIDISKARRVVHSLIDRIAQDEFSLIELTNIRDFDEYTYAHSANVCVYALTMGIRLGLDRQQLSQLGFAALFHDIGKVKLPEDLIRKPDVFDENDWIQMQKHPLLGAKTILRNIRFDQHAARAALVAFEHHINNDYTGYPVLNRKRPTILFSRIVAIADTFDALSSGRVYLKKSIPPDEVLRKMMYQMTVKFDDFLLKLFVSIIGVYPAGTLVLLSTEQLAVVSRNSSSNLSRPVVKLIGDKSGPYEEFVEMDLSQPEHSGKKVVKIIDPAGYNIDIKSIILSDK
ncbi:MAG: HD domain-containing protein [Candidatus Zixiibacteriota bacterium]|nr:MAG: HD domain-containing protein [candidate division Zixibacteria bacterium]